MTPTSEYEAAMAAIDHIPLDGHDLYDDRDAALTTIRAHVASLTARAEGAEATRDITLSPIVEAAWKVVDESGGDCGDYTLIEKKHLDGLERALDNAGTFGSDSFAVKVAKLTADIDALVEVAKHWWNRKPSLGTYCNCCHESVAYELGIADIVHKPDCPVLSDRVQRLLGGER